MEPKEAVSLVRGSLAAYQKFQDMSDALLSKFGLRMLADSYELVVAKRRHILDQDMVAAGRTYAVSESMDVEVATEGLELHSTAGPQRMLSQHGHAFVAADLRKCA